MHVDVLQLLVRQIFQLVQMQQQIHIRLAVLVVFVDQARVYLSETAVFNQVVFVDPILFRSQE